VNRIEQVTFGSTRLRVLQGGPTVVCRNYFPCSDNNFSRYIIILDAERAFSDT
jgi:hypothetical protein